MNHRPDQIASDVRTTDKKEGTGTGKGLGNITRREISLEKGKVELGRNRDRGRNRG